MAKELPKILVVDDDREIVNFICDILIDNNYEVLSAFDGEMAIDIIKKEIPDLIILDWEMPIKDGITTLNEIKQDSNLSSIPVIMITGRLHSNKDLKTAFDSGVIDFINKPIEAIELIARTKSMVLLNQYYKESVRKKDMELTLMSKTNHQHLTMLKELSEIVEKINEKQISNATNVAKVQELKEKLKTVKANIRNNSWEQFQEHFLKVHPNFQHNLLTEHPNLTNEEIKLSYFLRLNMCSKEIASITNKEIHSIDIGRYRLRKKLQLDRSEKLNSYLSKF